MLSGLLVLNKPAGVSSRDCVNHVQRIIGNKRLKVGHAGTLDPLATGVLLIAIGEATRLVEQYHELDKRYLADFEFAKSSDTLDREGQVVVHAGLAQPTANQLVSACRTWIGPQVMQQPPRYSAIKIQGQRAYDLARRGAEFEPDARPVAIYDLQVIDYRYPHWQLEIHCGSGTYVRSLGRDIALQLGNAAIMNELVRTAIGPFSLSSAIAMDELQERDQMLALLLSPTAGLVGWHRADVSLAQAQALRQGQKITLHVKQFSKELAGDRWLAIDEAEQLVALLDVHPTGYARPARVFQSAMATNQLSSTRARHKPES